jgi:transcriptional regulator of met regulon
MKKVKKVTLSIPIDLFNAYDENRAKISLSKLLTVALEEELKHLKTRKLLKEEISRIYNL